MRGETYGREGLQPVAREVDVQVPHCVHTEAWKVSDLYPNQVLPQGDLQEALTAQGDSGDRGVSDVRSYTPLLAKLPKRSTAGVFRRGSATRGTPQNQNHPF